MRMNKKVVFTLGLVLIAAAVAMLALPVSAAVNGDALQTQDKLQLKDQSCDGCTCDCTCAYDGDGLQLQYKTQLKLQNQECLCQNVGVNAP